MKRNIKLFFLLSGFVPLIACCECSKYKTEKEGTKQGFELPEKAIVLTNQADASIVIVDAEAKKAVWKWTAAIAGVPTERRSWFSNPSEVKTVYGNKCILMTASGGAVALIRIADKKLLYYAHAGNNPHSAELLPDGNIVTAASTGAILATFYTDTIKGFGTMAAQYEMPAVHNVYWDAKRKKVFSVTHDMFSFDYNFVKEAPRLLNPVRIHISTPDGEPFHSAHDLFPIYGRQDNLWLTNNDKVWIYDQNTDSVTSAYNFAAVKSVSKSKHGVLMLCPSEGWWSDRLIDEKGNTVFRGYGYKIYKARWFIQ